MAKKRSKIASDIMRRVKWLYFIFLFVAVAIIARIIWIQYGPSGAELRAKSERITFSRVAIEATRGDILAGDGRLLATSIPTYEIRMDFNAAGLDDDTFNKSVDSLAYCLSRFFGDRSKSAYKTMLVSSFANRSKNRYKLISPRRIDYLEEQEVGRFPIFRLGQNGGGYIKEQINKRIMPHGTLAQRTIGMTNLSGVKIGVEGAFDNQLKGVDGSTLMQRVSGSFKVPVVDPMNIDPVNGLDVLTTLNIDIQDIAESSLKQQLQRHNADWGTVVLMEVATGEIHAMANLTRKPSGACIEDFNYAIGRRMEPGSTFKLATLIALVEDAKISVEKTYDCENGRAMVGKRVVVDTHKEGVISLKNIFGVSSNIGFAKAVDEAYSTNPGRFVDFISDNLSFGKSLEMQISGERDPLIKHPKKRDTAWDGTSLVMMSYGYALEITPIQTLALYNAVANNGRMMRPRLVREIQSYGESVHHYKYEVVNSSICSSSTIKIIRDCLENVVDEGTGGVLKNPHYSVAAKTGTAQVAFDNGGYIDRYGGHNYLATMVGYFPADNPKYTCIVAIKTYHSPSVRNVFYGSPLAGPVFKAIADRVYASNPSWHKPVNVGKAGAHPAASDIKNGRSAELKEGAKALSVPAKIDRRAEEWAYVGSYTQDGYLEVASIERPDALVPSVIGMGLKDAIYLLESSGLRVSFSGKGRVVSQSIEAGSAVEKGERVRIEMEL